MSQQAQRWAHCVLLRASDADEPTNRLYSIRCVGIEIVPALHAAAAEVWARIAADRPRPAEGAPWPAAVCDDVEFILVCD